MTHLSDEAVAAFADGVLTGVARTRAARHTESCTECADAVRGQREAVMALRTAAAPELPCGLLDRLRGLPEVTPISSPPTVFLPDGTAMLSTTGALGSVAALVPPQPAPRPPRSHSFVTPLLATAAVAALAGTLAASASADTGGDAGPGSGNTVRTVQQRQVPAEGPMAPLFTADVLRPGAR